MKNFIVLERYHNHFYAIEDTAFEDLRYLIEFLSTDYRYNDRNIFNKVLNFYNSSFVYHDFSHKMLHIGFSEWEIRTEIPVPCDYEFPDYLNESNSCKMSVDNLLEFRKKWQALKQEETPFAIIYRDDRNWIFCRGFDRKKNIAEFVEEQSLEL